MKRLIVLTMLVAVSVGCAPTRAGRGPNTIADRQQQQRKNIEQGARQGDLTRDEAAILGAGSRRIDQDRRDARQDDGYIDQAERQQLRQQQKNLGKAIRQNRNDDETR